MSVQVSVPLSALADSRVAHALNHLLSVLAGAESGAGTGPAIAPMAAVAAGPRPDSDARYSAFMEALPERSREFLALVESKGVLTIGEAMEALDVHVGKAMGGITGSIARWAPEHDVTVPFEAIKSPNGKRAWRWIGYDRRPAPPVPVRARRRRRAPSKTAKVASDPPSIGERVTRLKAALPPDSAQFIDLLEDRGALSQAEVLAHFGLARAQGLSRILSPLGAIAAKLDLAGLVETEVSATGDRGWRWGLRAPSVTSTSNTAPSAQGPPGVRVRKRSR